MMKFITNERGHKPLDILFCYLQHSFDNKKVVDFSIDKNNKPDFRRDPTNMKLATRRMCRTISSTCFLLLFYATFYF